MRAAMNRPPTSRRSRPQRQRGIALLLALWLTILLTVIASGFAFSMRSEALAARNMVSLSQARAAPEAGCRGWDAGHGRCVQL